MNEKVFKFGKKNKKNFYLSILFIYVILFGLSIFTLRKAGFDYISHVYNSNFLLISGLFIILSVLTMFDELDMKKILSWLLLIVIVIFEVIILFIISIVLKFVLDIGHDSIKNDNGNYYVESIKPTGGMDTKPIVREDFITESIKRIK